jgi:hypothetical protein
MDSEQLDHILSQTRLGIELDEAEAKQRMADAAEKRKLLGVIENLKGIVDLQAEEIQQLKQNKQVVNNITVNHDYIANQNIQLHQLNPNHGGDNE